ncbi:hypothetical protein JANAI62_10180 [Jannaschia pagri]|uniref:HTH cro/C1-type domain-containing protein n=1 Tax=Jannaschia pagri TaxID=2829797 RepID=A0ABQ4NJI0_9RHOB|nr:hypothetical protein JANAI61_10210 [Jannaschia sp. AI_61]GIT94395.1 hypothetical protein JANAI62_10180 [Jannaschia sp. AI_62]
MDVIAFAALIKRKRGDKGLSQQRLALAIYNDEARKGDISRLENARVASPQEKTVRLLCDALDISDAEMEPIRQSRSTAQKLGDIPTLSRDDLELLSARFGIADVADRTDTDLRQLLTLKAKEYREWRIELEGLRERGERLDNIAAEALAELDAFRIEEAEALLRNAREIAKDALKEPLERNARLMELEAQGALLRGNVERAATLLEDAAGSFRIINPLEPARRKVLRYAEKLGRHGIRYGGNALMASVDLMRDVADDTLRSEDAWLWAAAKNAEAIGLRNQGNRTEGATGADLLAQAVTAYRAALEVCTRADHPVQWATTQNNLGIALRNQGTRSEGAAGADLLAQAVTAYRAALEVRTRADRPVQWAMTQNNLGNALKEQGTRTEGAAGAALLAQAVTAYRAALEVNTRADHPVQWAITQNNLGIALQEQGIRTEGAAGADLLAQAITACRAALEVRTRADRPVQWAMTQTNIAFALLARSSRPDAGHPANDLRAALDAVDGALEVYDPVHMSYDHGTATRLRDDIQAALDAL